MQPIRLIAMDMDGTLLAGDPRRIPEANVAALRCAHEAGIHLALASGRLPDDAGFFALDAGLPMHILALNGGCCLDKPLGDIRRTDYLDRRDAAALMALVLRSGLHYGVFADHTLVISDESMSDADLLRIYGDHVLRPGGRTQILRGRFAAEQQLRQGANKLLVYTDEAPSALPPLREAVTAACPHMEVTSSWANNLEINPVGVHKGSALTALADALGVPMAQVMALGDNDNDLPMLRAAGVSVAMANATHAARAAARYITASNEACGVAEAIRCLALAKPSQYVRRST